MAEPARKIESRDKPNLSGIDGGGQHTPERASLEEFKPNITPDFSSIDGGGQHTPKRASLEDLSKREKNQEQSDDNEEASIKNKEEKTSETADWQDKTEQPNRQYTDSRGHKHDIKAGKFSFLKKKGPATLLTGGILGGGSIIAMLFSPGLLIVQIKEVMVNKFNNQLTSMEIRTSRKLTRKINTTTNNLCSTARILCRYTTMTKKQMNRFIDAGIVVEGAETKFGRIKPTKFKYNGVDINAKDFNKMMRDDAAFRKAVKQGYNPKFAGYADNIWKRAAKKLGIATKAKIRLKGDDPKAKLEDMQAKAKGGIDANDIASPSRVDADGFLLDENGQRMLDGNGNPVKATTGADLPNIGDDLAKAGDDALKKTDDILKKGGKETGEEAMEEVIDSATKATSKVGANVFKITSWVDNLCIVYNTVRAVGFAAKTVRALQLARYAFLFFNIADQIKAGNNPDPDDLSYLGDILTKEVIESATTAAVRSATDSFGYRYAAYGDSHKSLMTNFTSQFLAGGGLAGDFIYVTSKIKNAFGKDASGKLIDPTDVCKTLANPWVGIGSAVVGIALMFIPGAGQGFALKNLVSAGTIGSLLLVAGQIILPSLLADLVAGKIVGEGTFGELSGEAITSGAGTIMSKAAQTGGNAPLKPAEAKEYAMLSQQIARQYAEEDRIGRSPLDATSQNTFLGKVLYNLTPYLAKISSPASFIQSIASIASGSLNIASRLGIVRAVDESEFTQCPGDEDYDRLEIATDPFCNVFYGIPVNELESGENDPVKIVEDLIDEYHINNNGDPISAEYEEFLKDCINRENPLGYGGQDGTEDDGEKCILSKDNPNYSLYKKFYLYSIDSRIEDGMSGEDEVLNAATDFGYISFYDPIDNEDNIAEEDIYLEEASIYEEEDVIEVTANIPVSNKLICLARNQTQPISSLYWLYGIQNLSQTKREITLA